MNNTQKKTIAKTSIQTLAYNISVTQQFSLGRTILTVFLPQKTIPKILIQTLMLSNDSHSKGGLKKKKRTEKMLKEWIPMNGHE